MKTSYLSKHFLLMAILSLSAAISYAQDQKPEESLNALKDGNKRFCSGQLLHTHQDLSRIDELKTGQKPFAIVVSCSDSRVTPEIVFDQGLGDIFSIRTAGNVMADYEEGSIEYAAEHLSTKLIVVMGHTSCGAVKAFMDIKHSHENHDAHHTGKLGHIESIIKKLDSEEEEDEVFETEGDVYNRAIIANVIHGVKQLRKSEPFLKEMHEDGDVQIVGAIYHIESGEVEFLDI